MGSKNWQLECKSSIESISFRGGTKSNPCDTAFAFRITRSSPEETVGRFEFVGPEIAKPVSDPWNADIGDVPQLLRQAGVGRVILVHGTFAGNDIVGLTRPGRQVLPDNCGPSQTSWARNGSTTWWVSLVTTRKNSRTVSRV